MRTALLLAAVVVLAAVPVASADYKDGLDGYRVSIHNQHGWTNRTLENRCRDRIGFKDFTKTPLSVVKVEWRDNHLDYARARHHRAKAKTSLCSPRGIGQYLAAKLYGWTGYQWTALDAIVMRESGWNPCRHYPSTTNCSYAGPSACGIPQAVPCSKLLIYCGTSTIGACSASTQIRWMLGYIHGRYGSPAAALANGSTY